MTFLIAERAIEVEKLREITLKHDIFTVWVENCLQETEVKIKCGS